MPLNNMDCIATQLNIIKIGLINTTDVQKKDCLSQCKIKTVSSLIIKIDFLNNRNIPGKCLSSLLHFFNTICFYYIFSRQIKTILSTYLQAGSVLYRSVLKMQVGNLVLPYHYEATLMQCTVKLLLHATQYVFIFNTSQKRQQSAVILLMSNFVVVKI